MACWPSGPRGASSTKHSLLLPILCSAIPGTPTSTITVSPSISFCSPPVPSTYVFAVRHHHVEGNGPDDLSSTIRYQRDDIWNLLHYIGRFVFLIWFDLPRYFISKGHYKTGLRAGFSEFATFGMWYLSSRIDGRATICVFLLPFMVLRLGLMVGNWGQHAFVDEMDPDSDFRSSITLIDVAVSNPNLSSSSSSPPPPPFFNLIFSFLLLPLLTGILRATVSASTTATTPRTTSTRCATGASTPSLS